MLRTFQFPGRIVDLAQVSLLFQSFTSAPDRDVVIPPGV